MKKIILILALCSLIIIGGTQKSEAQCTTGYSQIIVNIIPDTYPNETSWDIRDTANIVIASGTINSDTICYQTGIVLHFTIYDSYGDGICCGGFGNGSYSVYLDGNLVATGGHFGYFETTYFNYPPGANSSTLINDYQQLLNHCNSTSPLSPSQINAIAADINLNHFYMADDLAVITAAFNLINCYETNPGPLFLNTATTGGFPNAYGALDGFEYHRAIFQIQQQLFDVLYCQNRIAQYHTFLNGKKYLTSNYFPGACPLPVDSTLTYSATVNASMPASWGNPTAWATVPARRPTGYYLSPGTIGKVKVPTAMVNAGYQIIVGAHPLMDSTVHPTIQRFFGISNTYNITDTVTLIANPFGGGIYINTPYQASAGLQQIELTNVVPAPFFSATSFNTTTLSQWQTVQRNNPAPWADFETEKFMMQVPTSFIYNYSDPVTLMADWDARMDVVSNLMGYPLIRNNKILYVMLDVQIKFGAYGIGYPQINNPYSPYTVQNGNSSMWFLVPGAASMWESEFHELGHSQHMGMFPGENEAIVNLLSAPIYNQLYGMSIDSAFGMSFNNEYWRSRDQSAINWMITHNFRIGHPMDISNTTKDEVRYQHRGYGKYVEIAALFGWGALHNYFQQINLDYNNAVPPGPLSPVDDRILRLSKAAGADLRPLIHFWGVQPQDSAALAVAIDTNNLLPSPLICNRLTHYLSIIPMDSTQFYQQAQVYFNGPVPAGGNPDYEEGWYNVWLPQYNNLHGDSAVTALQHIIDTYFPSGSCATTVNIPHEINSNSSVSVFPNPNTGQFTVSLPDDNDEITVTDILGQQIIKTKATQKIINLQLDNNGVYIIYVKTKQETIARKIVVNR
jgi:hypothetical protein